MFCIKSEYTENPGRKKNLKSPKDLLFQFSNKKFNFELVYYFI